MVELIRDVKPCPFCGGGEIYSEAYEHHSGVMRFRIVCGRCMGQVDTGTFTNRWQAIDAWNRRAEPKDAEDTNR